MTARRTPLTNQNGAMPSGWIRNQTAVREPTNDTIATASISAASRAIASRPRAAAVIERVTDRDWPSRRPTARGLGGKGSKTARR
jgi:hypothetical protein